MVTAEFSKLMISIISMKSMKARTGTALKNMQADITGISQ